MKIINCTVQNETIDFKFWSEFKHMIGAAAAAALAEGHARSFLFPLSKAPLPRGCIFMRIEPRR